MTSHSGNNYNADMLLSLAFCALPSTSAAVSLPLSQHVRAPFRASMLLITPFSLDPPSTCVAMPTAHYPCVSSGRSALWRVDAFTSVKAPSISSRVDHWAY